MNGMINVGRYKDFEIMGGPLPKDKPIMTGGSLRGMRKKDENEKVLRIFIHIGQKYKSSICMDSWNPEPMGWVLEFASCYMISDMINEESPPRGLMMALAEKHAIKR